jgi:hypothetical protein
MWRGAHCGKAETRSGFFFRQPKHDSMKRSSVFSSFVRLCETNPIWILFSWAYRIEGLFYGQRFGKRDRLWCGPEALTPEARRELVRKVVLTR